MPTIPFRTLGKYGVITDVNDVDLPIEAVSDARNVRFADGRITNAHVWRLAKSSPSGGTPVFSFTVENTNDSDILGYVASDGSAFHIYNGAETNVTPGSFTPAASVAPISVAELQGVTYLNQQDRVPWYFNSISTDYDELPNWDADHRCKVIRSFKDYLIALNVTKTSAVYPNMVKWSDIAQYDDYPASWDETDPTNSAGENSLSEIQTEILDGMSLRNSFIIYASDQVWAMESTDGPDVFQFFKAFGDHGILNLNCVQEVDGAHLVFDDDDIYMHDGVSPPKSICDGRVRKRIFRNLDLSKRTIAFSYHHRAASEVWFCYNSRESNLKWDGADCTYCNIAAAYNYISDTWTFHDLPNITSMTDVSWQESTNYDASAISYASYGSTYADIIANATRSSFCPSIAATGVTTTRFLNMDSGINTSLPFAEVAELVVEPFAVRTGLDLDEAIPELKTYKNYRSVYPQVTVSDEEAVLSFKFGGVDYPQQALEWDTLQTFDPVGDYKIDTRSRGRYLAWYFIGENANTYTLSGFDLDLVSVSRR
jgi:hypothetical protein